MNLKLNELEIELNLNLKVIPMILLSTSSLLACVVDVVILINYTAISPGVNDH